MTSSASSPETKDTSGNILARVLLVDDNHTFASDILDLLSPLYNVAHAATGEEALRHIDEIAPEVVLLDIQLGRGMDGFAVLDKLADRSTTMSVIMLTESSDPKSVVRAL